MFLSVEHYFQLSEIMILSPFCSEKNGCSEAEDVYVLSICVWFIGFFFLLEFFTAGEGWNGSWLLETIQHTQALISYLCITVLERTHIGVVAISDMLFVRQHLVKGCARDKKEGERNKQTKHANQLLEMGAG